MEFFYLTLTFIMYSYSISECTSLIYQPVYVVGIYQPVYVVGTETISFSQFINCYHIFIYYTPSQFHWRIPDTCMYLQVNQSGKLCGSKSAGI